jgi:dihydroxyacid dehydratase/phosphogluconate dehydratase
MRSDAWLGGDDEVALNHRAALRAAGFRRSRGPSGSQRSRQSRRPLIGIASTASDLNRCDRGLSVLAAAVRRGVLAAGGLPLEFPVMSLSEDLMKPTAMLYRNLLAIELEETIRSQPLDGIVALGNCDKTVPAYLMALASADIPALIVTGGFRAVPLFRGDHPPVRGRGAARAVAAARAVRLDQRAGTGDRRRGPDRDRADGRPGSRGRGPGGAGGGGLTPGSVRTAGDGCFARGVAGRRAGAVAARFPGDLAARIHGSARQPGTGRGGDQGRRGQPGAAAARGPAVVFHSYQEMRARVDDPALDVCADSVLVLAGCGPVGMAMPEWGNIPIPAKLLSQGVTDMLRITDGRMSGTGFGTVVLHAAPGSAVGGPLSRLRDGDVITLDAYAGSLSVSADLSDREPLLPAVSDRRGWPVLHRNHVLQAPEGCDYDFLAARTPDQLTFIEPVIGRS